MASYRTLTNWSIKRSGAGLTVQGVDLADARIVKLTGVKEVRHPASGAHFSEGAGPRAAVAVMTDGTFVRLST